jgi:rhodanese-related sulfurtransferase
MPAHNAISPDKLFRLLGTPACPAIVDVRPDEAFGRDPRLIPGAVRRPPSDVRRWAPQLDGRSAIAACVKGEELSQGAAALLRQQGVPAEALEGGVAGWAAAGLPMVPACVLPPRDEQGRTAWVTRARPKVDRIACPWLIRRFVDPDALFLFVPPADVPGVAEQFQAAPFDIEGESVFWSHRGELCTFDVMVAELGLGEVKALQRLAPIVRGADTARPDLAPQAAGLLAVSLGLSRMHADDLAQLDAGMLVYDALYRWCRDAVDETHDWVSHQPRRTVPA